MNILVTGGAGFIGSHVCEASIQKGHSVWCLDNFYPSYGKQVKLENIRSLSENSKFRLIPSDILDVPSLSKLFSSTHFDQVVHLAALAGVRPSLEQPAFYQRTNVEGTVNILEMCRTFQVPKIIIASSSSVYGECKNVPFSESQESLKPISPYAASKLACEGLGYTYHHLYGLDVTMLRFFTVYGPRQRPDLAISKFADLILKGLPVPVFGDGTTARDYTYIADIVSGVMACIETKFKYEIFNLGGSKTVSLSVLIRLLEESIGKQAIINRLAPQPGDVPLTSANISKAEKMLGYKPQYQLEMGIAEYVNWLNKTELRRTCQN